MLAVRLTLLALAAYVAIVEAESPPILTGVPSCTWCRRRGGEPVCGANGKTLMNLCYAKCKGISVVQPGACPQKRICACNRMLRPVCGSNGKTYGNACTARCAGVTIKSQGKCGSSPVTICICTSIYRPVCGANGKTYSNRCQAKCAHTSVSYKGRCEKKKVNRCICGRIYAPVCGSDKKTYANTCMAKCADVKVEHAGKCNEHDDQLNIQDVLIDDHDDHPGDEHHTEPTTPSLKRTSLDKFVFTTQRKPRLSHNQRLPVTDIPDENEPENDLIITDNLPKFDVDLKIDDEAWSDSEYFEQEQFGNHGNNQQNDKRDGSCYYPIPASNLNMWHDQEYAGRSSFGNCNNQKNDVMPDVGDYYDDDWMNPLDFNAGNEQGWPGADFQQSRNLADSDDLPTLCAPRKRNSYGVMCRDNQQKSQIPTYTESASNCVANYQTVPQPPGNFQLLSTARSPLTTATMVNALSNQKRRLDILTNQQSPFNHSNNVPANQQAVFSHMTNASANQRSAFGHVCKTPPKKNRLVGIACRTPKIQTDGSPDDIFNSPLPGTISGPIGRAHESVTAQGVMKTYDMQDLESPRLACGRNANENQPPLSSHRFIASPAGHNSNEYSSSRPQCNSITNYATGLGRNKACIDTSTYNNTRHTGPNTNYRQPYFDPANDDITSQVIPFHDKWAKSQQPQIKQFGAKTQGGNSGIDDIIMDDEITTALDLLEGDSDFEDFEEDLVRFNVLGSPGLRKTAGKSVSSANLWSQADNPVICSPVRNISQLSSPTVQPTWPRRNASEAVPRSMFCLQSKEDEDHEEAFDDMLGDLLKDCVKKD